jgi:mannose-6-phosphate isomerase-like protein (cupin superfamily)
VEVKRSEETRVDKPWGYEIRWAVTDRYLGKILHINRGEALSLQYHERKDEWILLVKGAIDFESGSDERSLRTRRLQTGDSVHITPGTRHRMTAIEDTDIFEVSTPDIEDVVRLEDRYGRVPPSNSSPRKAGGG